MLEFGQKMETAFVAKETGFTMNQCVCVDCDEIWVRPLLCSIVEEACPSCGSTHFCFAEVNESCGLFTM